MGMLLLAVPVLVHIFKPRKTRRTAFTNIRWLRESQHKLTRRVQWHQILLFLFRAALVSLLVLVLARPVLNLGSGEPRERFIILDRSRTMTYREPGKEGEAPRQTPFDRGRSIAEALLAASGPGDRTTVVLASRTPKALGPLTADPQAYAVALRNAEALPQEGDLGAALPIVRSMLGTRRDKANVEIIFITNSLQSNWSQSAISSFLSDNAKNLTVRVIDVAPATIRNAWLADAAAVENAEGRISAIRVEAGWSGDGDAERSVYVTGLAGLPELSTSGLLRPGLLTPLEIELPAGYDLRGKIARVEMRPGDSLPDDDSLLLNLNPRGLLNVLVIESEVTQVKALQPGLHLRSALQSLARVQKGGLEIRIASPQKLTDEEIAQANLFIMVEPDGISDAHLNAIESRVRAGCGLAIFLGPSVNVSFFNERLHRSSNPAASLSPVALNQAIENRRVREETVRLTSIDWNHPLLANLFDPAYNDFPQTRVTGYFGLGAWPQETPVRVLARIGSSVPAILESDFGDGKVVLFNMTANDAWSDLPRRPSFIPLLDRLVAHLSGGVARRMFMAGEPVVYPIGSFDKAPQISVTEPSGESLHPTLRRVGGQFVMQLDSPEKAGIYEIKIEGSAETRTFVVQTGRSDSNLARMKPELLEQWWAPAKFETVTTNRSSEEGGKPPAVSDRNILLWPWFAGLACLILMGEMALVHWLCPKINPMLAESRVSKGLLQKQGVNNEG